MALQVWLPLNGDIHNQGLNQNIIPSELGTVSYDNSGKIGKCFISGGTSQVTNGISLNNNFVDIFNNPNGCSIAVWIKPVGNHFHYNGTIVSSGNWNSQCWSFGVSQDNTKVDALCKGINTYISCNIPVNEWTHLVGVFKDGISKVYKNGIYVGQLTGRAAFDSNASNTCIGRETYASDYFGFNGRINDVRIYNHALSDKEIKEISKGLVLHYKLDNIGSNENLLPVASQRLSANGSTSSNEYMNLCSTLQIYDTYGLVPYTLSFDAKAAVAHSFSIYGTYGSNPKYAFTSKSINVTTEWQRFTHTFTPYVSNSSGTWAGISIYGTYGSGAIVSVRNVKFELGINPTLITNQPNIIYDCSGYENNGSILGSLTLSNDISRYNYSTNFDGDTSGIIIENLNIGNIINTAITYSFWIKPNGENGARSVYFGNYSASPAFNIEKTTGNKLRFYWNGSPDLTTNLSITDGQWQHIVITKNGTTEVKVYLNGSLIQTLSNTFNNLTFPTTYRIGRDTRTGTTSYKGLMSDFRIYCTALSDQDILELYHNPTNIDDHGNMFTFEFDEAVISKQQILQTGITKIDNFVEIMDKIKVLDDGSVFLQILHHNNPASNLFTVSNCWLNNTENLYSALILLKNIFKDLTEYEFLACEKIESTSTEAQIRWKQTNNPANTSTASGYTLISGNPTHLSPGLVSSGGSHGCIDINGSDWWCCCGSYTAYQGGIPGFNGVIKSGYLDLYIRIPEDVLKGNIGNFAKFFKKSILSTQFIEK